MRVFFALKVLYETFESEPLDWYNIEDLWSQKIMAFSTNKRFIWRYLTRNRWKQGAKYHPTKENRWVYEVHKIHHMDFKTMKEAMDFFKKINNPSSILPRYAVIFNDDPHGKPLDEFHGLDEAVACFEENEFRFLNRSLSIVDRETDRIVFY